VAWSREGGWLGGWVEVGSGRPYPSPTGVAAGFGGEMARYGWRGMDEGMMDE